MPPGPSTRSRSRSAHSSRDKSGETRANNGRNENNIYNELNDDVMEHELMNNQSANVNNYNDKIKKKFPPTTIFDVNVNDLKQDIIINSDVEIRNVDIRLTQHGIKLYTHTDSDYRELYTFLVNKRYQFFSHTLNDERSK